MIPGNGDRHSLSPERHEAAEVVRRLGLEPLEREGGFFRRTVTAERRIKLDTSDPSVPARPAFSVILALFTPEGFSALHRLAQDEIWFYQAGDPLELWRFHPDGRVDSARLGPACGQGEVPHAMVPAGVWQGAQVAGPGRWSLVSCVVAPAFDWSDFEPGLRGQLCSLYPEHAALISTLTRESGV